MFKERAYGPVRAKPFMLGWFDCSEEVKWEINHDENRLRSARGKRSWSRLMRLESFVSRREQFRLSLHYKLSNSPSSSSYWTPTPPCTSKMECQPNKYETGLESFTNHLQPFPCERSWMMPRSQKMTKCFRWSQSGAEQRA